MENHCGMCALDGCPDMRHGRRPCLAFRGRTIENCEKAGGYCVAEAVEGCEGCGQHDILKFRNIQVRKHDRHTGL